MQDQSTGRIRLPPPKEGEKVGVEAKRKIMKKEQKEEAKAQPLTPKLEFDDPFVHPPDEPPTGGYHYPTVPAPDQQLTLIIDEPVVPPPDEPPPPPPRQNRYPDQPLLFHLFLNFTKKLL